MCSEFPQLNIGWTEEQVEKVDLLALEDHAYHAKKGGKGAAQTNLDAKKKITDKCSRPGKNSYHPDYRAAIQERRQESAADSSEPPNIA